MYMIKKTMTAFFSIDFMELIRTNDAIALAEGNMRGAGSSFLSY